MKIDDKVEDEQAMHSMLNVIVSDIARKFRLNLFKINDQVVFVLRDEDGKAVKDRYMVYLSNLANHTERKVEINASFTPLQIREHLLAEDRFFQRLISMKERANA